METSFGPELGPLVTITAASKEPKFRVTCRACMPPCINPNKTKAGLLTAEEALKLQTDHIQHHIISLAGELVDARLGGRDVS